MQLRIKGKKERAKALLDLVSNTSRCRMQQLVAYFGESSTQTCGICDACVKANQHKLENRIKALLTKPLLPALVADALPEVPKQQVASVIKAMLNRGDIITDDKGRLALP